MAKRVLLGLLGLVVFVVLARFFFEARYSRTTVAKVGVVEGLLYRCPDKPNCVSSDSINSKHAIEPIADASGQAWAELPNVIARLEGAELVRAEDDYLHATFRSSVFGFVDDLEVHRRGQKIAVRSASRVGYSDLGANRNRVEEIRGLVSGL